MYKYSIISFFYVHDTRVCTIHIRMSSVSPDFKNKSDLPYVFVGLLHRRIHADYVRKTVSEGFLFLGTMRNI